ncbi:MAG: response regulator transcription factor [Gemmatimonadales bacterium]
MTVPPLSVLIADDHAVLRAGLRLLLEAQPDMVVVGEAGDGSEVSRKARELRPDVVLMDLSMPGPPSGEAIRQVLRACPTTRVLVLTMHDDAAYATAALAAGAAGYVVKKVADTELLLAIRAVHSGRSFLDLTNTSGPPPHAVPKGAGAPRQPPKDLSRREREVLRLLAQGHSNQAIADQIGVSVKTVETYRTRLREKLGLKGRAQLYRFAVESGILDTAPDGPSEGGS